MVFLLANRQHSALEWKGLFEGLYDIDEHLPVFRIFGSVAGEMNINASPAELRIEVSKCKQFVSPKQHVYGLRLVGDGLDYVQLIEEAAARRNLAEMLGLIDHHRHRLAVPDGLLHGETVFSTDCPRWWHEPHDRTSLSIQFVVDQRLVKLMEKAFVVIAPIKTSGLGSYCFDTDDRNPCWVFVKFTQNFRINQLLRLHSQRCLTDPSRAKHKYERVRLSAMDRIHQCFFGFHEPRMRHCEGAKMVDG